MTEIINKLQLTVPEDARTEWNRKYKLHIPEGASFLSVLIALSNGKEEISAMISRVEMLLERPTI